MTHAALTTVAGIVLLAAVAAGAQERATVNAITATSPGEYRIGPEDSLTISVWKNESLSRTVPVRPDGMISLPLVHDVRVLGLTPAELRDILVRRLSPFMPSPEVSVIVAEVRSFKVSVMGEVMKPARYDLKSWTTVLDVLAMAGGFTQFASRSKIVILRQDGQTVKRIPFNYPSVVASGSEQANFYLQPGDIVLVP
jgi:polysaccharide export outer membrane protein